DCQVYPLCLARRARGAAGTGSRVAQQRLPREARWCAPDAREPMCVGSPKRAENLTRCWQYLAAMLYPWPSGWNSATWGAVCHKAAHTTAAVAAHGGVTMSEARRLAEALEAFFTSEAPGWFSPITTATDGLTAAQASKAPRARFNSVWAVVNHVR